MTPSELSAWGTAIGIIVGALIGGISASALLRRRLSRDRTEIAKDKVESRFVDRLLEEHDTRRKDAEAIARLTAENRHQAHEILRLQQEFAAFRRLIFRRSPELARLYASDFAPLLDDPL